MPRPIIATINLAALQHNLHIAKISAPASNVWAIVKANGYGHGLENVVKAFSAADGLGLVEIDGAVRLRELGWRKKILLLEGFFAPVDLVAIADYQLDTAIHCVEQIAMIESSALSTPIDVHLKINTGMNRLGFKPDQAPAAYARLHAIAAVRNITMMTHFANADDALHPVLSFATQLARFNRATQGLTGERCLANSAATLLHTEVAADWIRPGIMLYGSSPGAKSAEAFGLLPAMTLTSEIIGIQDIDAGEAVGYGSRFVANKPTRVGVVACGYADGYPRHAGNGTPVLVDGIRTGIIGRVSMDMITVDLTDIADARIGSKVVLWGEGLSIDDVAEACGTLGYELMCALALRVPVVVQE